MDLFSWILSAIGILSYYILGRKNRWGWVINAGYQIVWIIYAIGTKQYGFIVVCIFFFVVAIKNFIEWQE
jgi:hypothetical protein